MKRGTHPRGGAKEGRMRLTEEIAGALFGEDVAFGGGKIVLLCGRGACFEDVKGLFSLSAEEVTVLLKGGTATVRGEGLAVARYGGGDLVLRGRVRQVELEGGPQP